MLAAYNAGPSPVQTWNERYGDTAGLLAIDLIPYKETRLYVSIILRNAYWYARLFSTQNDPLGRQALDKMRNAEWKADAIITLLEPLMKTLPSRELASLPVHGRE